MDILDASQTPKDSSSDTPTPVPDLSALMDSPTPSPSSDIPTSQTPSASTPTSTPSPITENIPPAEPAPVFPSSDPPKKTGINRPLFIAILLFFLLSIPVIGVFVVQRQQIADIRNIAAYPTGACSNEGAEQCGTGDDAGKRYRCAGGSWVPWGSCSTGVCKSGSDGRCTDKNHNDVCDTQGTQTYTCKELNPSQLPDVCSCQPGATVCPGGYCTVGAQACVSGYEQNPDTQYCGGSGACCPTNNGDWCDSTSVSSCTGQTIGEVCEGGKRCVASSGNSCSCQADPGITCEGGCYLVGSASSCEDIGLTHKNGTCNGTGLCCGPGAGTNTPTPSPTSPVIDPTSPPGDPTNTPIPPTNPPNNPTNTPTNTPVLGQCQNIKVYKDGAVVDPNTLRRGDAIVIAVVGTNATQARIKINDEATWRTSTTKNSSDEWVFSYQIPNEGSLVFTVIAELLIGGVWK